MATKKLKITETQNKAQPMVLVDRYDSYEHFAPLMTSNGSVDQEKFELQFYYNFITILLILLFGKKYSCLHSTTPNLST